MADKIRFKMRGKYATLEHTENLDKKLLGECDVTKRRIRVRESLSGTLWLDTTIHELLHLAFWDLDEEVVNQVATDMAKALTKLGVERNLDKFNKNLSKIISRRKPKSG